MASGRWAGAAAYRLIPEESETTREMADEAGVTIRLIGRANVTLDSVVEMLVTAATGARGGRR